jgi:hypothetical protein
MSDERSEARSRPDLAIERPSGLPDVKSETRQKTPIPFDPRDELGAAAGRDSEPASRDDTSPFSLPTRAKSAAAPAQPDEKRPPGLPHMTTSVRRRLQLVLEDDDPYRPSRPNTSDPKRPPKHAPAFTGAEISMARSLGRWVALCGLMTLTVGALTGLSYLTGRGTVAHVVVGILASALAVWLLMASLSFRRVARPEHPRPQQELLGAFALLRSALLLKAVLLFAALALGCVTFSLAASLLFLL